MATLVGTDPKLSVPSGTVARMNLFDLAPWGELLPRNARRFVGWVLLAAIAALPPAREWWMGQVEDHASDLTRRLVDIVTFQPEPASTSDLEFR